MGSTVPLGSGVGGRRGRWERGRDDVLALHPGAPSLLSRSGVQAPYSGQGRAAGALTLRTGMQPGVGDSVLPGTLENSSVVSPTHYWMLPAGAFENSGLLRDYREP